jgi:hypothetical protein
LSGASFHLSAGANKLGLLSQTKTKGGYPVWNGFSFITIRKQAFSITTASHVSMVENDVVLHSFFVKSPGQTIQYSWDMGDGSTLIQNTNIDSINYRYKKDGSFTITLRIFDLATNSLLGTETTTMVITLNPVSISPKGITGITNIPYAFYGLISVPKDIKLRYEWDMGNGKTRSNINNDSINFTYEQTGMFSIILKVFDTSKMILLGSTKTSIIISKPVLPTLTQLQSMKFVTAVFSANFRKSTYYNQYLHSEYSDEVGGIGFLGGNSSDTSSKRIIWSGSSFSANYSTTTSWQNIDSNNLYYQSYGSETEQQSMTGTGTSNLSLLSISSYYLYDRNNHSSQRLSTYDTEHKIEKQFACSKAFLIYSSPDTISYSVSGPILQNYVSSVENLSSDYSFGKPGGPGGTAMNIVSTYWNDPITTPTVTITFWK